MNTTQKQHSHTTRTRIHTYDQLHKPIHTSDQSISMIERFRRLTLMKFHMLIISNDIRTLICYYTTNIPKQSLIKYSRPKFSIFIKMRFKRQTNLEIMESYWTCGGRLMTARLFLQKRLCLNSAKLVTERFVNL